MRLNDVKIGASFTIDISLAENVRCKARYKKTGQKQGTMHECVLLGVTLTSPADMHYMAIRGMAMTLLEGHSPVT